MLKDDSFPVKLNVALERIQNTFAPYDLTPLREALRRKRFGLEQQNFERMAASHVTEVSELTLSRYLSFDGICELYPHDCLSAMVPRIMGAIVNNHNTSLVYEFTECVLWRSWDEWSDEERTVIQDCFNSLWCERVKHSDRSGLEVLIDAAPLGLATKELLAWWESDANTCAQLLVADLVLTGMQELQARLPYWKYGIVESFADSVTPLGIAVTKWLLSPKVQSNLEALWLSNHLTDQRNVYDVGMALEFLYSLADVEAGKRSSSIDNGRT